MTHLKSAYLHSLAGVGLVALTGVTTGILSSRTLGAQGRGELTALLLLPGLLGPLGITGISQAVGYLDSPARNTGKSIAGPALAAALCAGCLIALCLLPFLALLLPNLRRSLLVPAALCLVYLPLGFIYAVLRGADLAAGRFRTYNLLQVSVGIGQVAFMLLFLGIGRPSPATFAAAVVLAVVAVLVARSPVLYRMIARADLTSANLRLVLIKAWRFVQPELSGLALLRCDVLLLARLVSTEALGLYTVAMAVAFGQALTANPLAQVCFHSTSSAPTRAAATEALARQFRLLQILFIGMAGLVVAIAPTLIRLGFGPRFLGSARSAVILVLAMTVWSCSQLLEGGLRGMDLARLCSWANLAGLAVLVACAGSLVHAFGIAGMAVAMLAGQTASLAAKLILMRRTLGCDLSPFWVFSRRGLEEIWAMARLHVRRLEAVGSV